MLKTWMVFLNIDLSNFCQRPIGRQLERSAFTSIYKMYSLLTPINLGCFKHGCGRVNDPG